MPRKQLPLSFYEQLQTLVEGELSPAQFAELEVQLLADPDAREAYYDFMDVAQGLTEIASQTSVAASPMPSRESASARGRWRAVLQYAAVAATAIVLALFVEWGVLGAPPWRQPAAHQRIAISPPVPQFVATLVRSTDCDWASEHSPFFEGKRLLTSELRLNRGVAEFRFDTGVRLVLEGPARLRINSTRSADLDFGKVVLHGHELAAEFALQTPQATLFDVGTVYGVAVDERSNVEVHVFQGAVRVQPGREDNDLGIVEAGAARRIRNREMKSVPLRRDQFQLEVPGQTDLQRVSRDGLMAYDGFNGHSGDSPIPSWHAGGTGWKGIWRHEFGSSHPSRAVPIPGLSLEFPQHRNSARDGVLQLQPAANLAWRELQHPIRMDVDASYYVSFYMSKTLDIDPLTVQYGSLSLRTSENRDAPQRGDHRRILFGMGSDRVPILSHNDQSVKTAPPLAVEEPYFFVAKIVAGERTPDQTLLRVFSKNTPIPAREPAVWTSLTNPEYDDTVFDQVLLYVEGTEYLFDEIRVSSSWEAATNFDWPETETISE